MALPPKGDVTRPVFLASRWLRALGVAVIILALGFGVAAIVTFASAATYATPTSGFGAPLEATKTIVKRGSLLVGFAAVICGASVAMLCCAKKVKEGKRWAVTTGIALTTVVGFLIAFAMFSSLLAVALALVHPGNVWTYLGVTGLQIIIVGCCTYLVVQLARSYAGVVAIQRQQQQQQQQQHASDAASPLPTAQPWGSIAAS